VGDRATPSRIRENIAVFDCTLRDAEMEALAGLESGTRLGPDPDERETHRRPGFSSAAVAGSAELREPVQPSL
jgi:diketogulonate reductase-like aldo/keto reductase